MRAANRGLLLLITPLLLWAVGGHAFYRIDRSHDERAYDLLLDLIAYKKDLAKSISGPRVVLAGGSNAYYGIASHVVEEGLKVPVVNFALPFGAYDDRINLRLLEGMVRPGDVVVYAAGSFWGVEMGIDGAKRRASGFDSYLAQSGFPDYARQFDDIELPWKPRPETNTLMLAVVDSFAPKKGRSWIDDTNNRGDYTGCVPTPVLLPHRYTVDAPSLDLAATVRDGAARLTAKGARFLVALPWLFIDKHDRERWVAYRARLVRQYEPDILVLSADLDALLRSDRGDFCDSPVHLSMDVTRRRSENLAVALSPYSALSGPSPPR